MEPEIDDVLKRLPSGWGIVSHQRCPAPFLVSTQLVALPKVSDAQLRACMQPFWNRFPPEPIGETEQETPTELKSDLRQLMMEVANHPGKASTEYYTAMHWPASKGTRAKQQLESAQLIKCHSIKLARRGGGVEAIELLPSAFEKLGLKPSKMPGKGGFIHAWWINRVSMKLSDQKPEIEKILNGKAVDVAVPTTDGDGWIAYEVQLDTRESLVRDLLSKDLAGGFQRVVLCVQSKEDVERAEKIATGTKFKDKVEVKLLADFYSPTGGN